MSQFVVWSRSPTYIDEAVVCDLPAGLESQHVQGPRLLGREVGESGVCDVIGLQVELVEGGEELGDGADALVGHVDAVRQGEADQPGVEAGPEALLGDLVTAVDLQGVERLQELHQSLQASVSEVTTPQTETHPVSHSLSPFLLSSLPQCVDVLGTVRVILNEVENISIVGIQEADVIVAPQFD